MKFKNTKRAGFVLIIVGLFLIFLTSRVSASGSYNEENYNDYDASQTVIVNGFIDHVAYDYSTGEYIGVSKPDENGGIWKITIANKPYKDSSLIWLNHRFNNKKFFLQYLGDLGEDNEVEIVEFGWVSSPFDGGKRK